MVEIYVLSVIWATDSEVTTVQVVETSDGPISTTGTIILHLLMKWLWVQTVHWSKLVLNSGKILPTCSSFKTGWLRSSSCNNVGGNKCRLSTICAVFSIRVKVSGTSTINAILHKRRYFFAFFELAKASAKWARCATHAGRGNGQKK